ncbi:MAG: VCBS repeat-containing protein [Flavobacteriales bacterium]|nr:VCBS repeat-containing protein [Flavobacteriales bacterium]
MNERAGEASAPGANGPLVRMLDATRTGLDLVNDLRESPEMNYFTYPYLYHSGGVAIGDVDGDGAPDVLITTNRNGTRLYRNLGDLRFEDVTERSGIATGEAWCTGPSMADLNNDGHLDIHLCVGGPSLEAEGRRDLVFVNNGDGTFTERAAEMGLDLTTRSLQAYHEDLDHDGDLDVLVLATRIDFEHNNLVATYTVGEGSSASHRLMINEGNGHFRDATAEAGWLTHAWGLSASIGDLNGDGHRDVYVAHDFLEPDLVMVNDGHGSFTDRAPEILRHITMYSMGSDLADYNNDGLTDLCVMDMTPPEHARSKQNMASMRPDQFFQMVKLGWNRQYMANVLQLNNGDGSFSEIAHLAGVDRTDWSWAPLFVDMDNDGWKDLFVTNGVWRDITNNDFKVRMQRIVREQGGSLPFDQVMDLIPTARPENYLFRNKGDLTFEKAMDRWQYHHPAVSTGAAYGDLDADGDMDLVVCDVGSTPKVVENLASDGSNKWLQVTLTGGRENPFAIGSSVTIHSGSDLQTQELHLQRGFQGSMEPLLHFGLGPASVDSLRVDWYDGTCSVVRNPVAGERLALSKGDPGTPACGTIRPVAPMMAERSKELGLDHRHVESSFNDFATEILLPHRQSEHGPGICVGDLDGDGLDDLFAGGAAGQSDALFLQTADGRFRHVPQGPWTDHREQEVIGAHAFDADGDGDLDLYTACGSTEFGGEGPAYQDHLYLNQGGGRFLDASDALPPISSSTQQVVSADLDLDGDLDLFVGGRNVPGAYPQAPRSMLLRNDGQGRFTDATLEWAPDLEKVGMVTGAAFADIDGDRDPDLLLCGEWMPIRMFLNDRGALTDASQRFDTDLVGWWRSLAVADLDGDGDLDVVTGNIGLNNKFHPSKEKPLEIYMDDLDGTGTSDIVLAKHGSNGICVPVRGRECSSEQMPFIKERFSTYEDFSKADLNTLYGEENLARALHYSATHFAHVRWMNVDGLFQPEDLPIPTQIAPLQGIVIADLDSDGNVDIAGAGNLWGTEVETSSYDAGNGWILRGNGSGEFTLVDGRASGLQARGNVSDVRSLNVGGTPHLVVANVDGPLQVFGPVPSHDRKMASLGH